MSGFQFTPGPSTTAGTVTTSDTGTVTSTMIADATILNADVSQSAGIEGGKTRPDSYYTNGSQFFRETMPRAAVVNNNVPMASTGVMWNQSITLYKGDVISNIGFFSGSTALSAATHWWFALYDTALNKQGQTLDKTSTAWAAATAVTLGLTGSYTVTTTGVHYISVMVAATTVPSLHGSNVPSNVVSQASGITNVLPFNTTSGSALTTTAPATISSPSPASNCGYGWVS